jgi:hypothetical protein
MDKRILVTGASGNLGKLICEALDSDGFEVLRASSKPSLNSYFLDFENFPQTNLDSIASAAGVVIHCARVTNVQSSLQIESELKFLNALFSSGCKVIYIGSASSWLKTPNNYGKYKSKIEDFVIANGGSVATAGLIYGPNFQGQITQLKRLLKYSPLRVIFSPVNSLFLTQIDYFIKELILVARYNPQYGRYLIAHSKPVSFNLILKHFCLPGFRIPLKINSKFFLAFLRALSVTTSYFSEDSFSALLSEYDSKRMKELGIKHISNSSFQSI